VSDEIEPQVHEIGNRKYVVAPVQPLDVDGVRTMLTGAILWAIALLALLPFIPTLKDHGNLWWIYTCAAGFGLGILGWDVCRRRQRKRKSTGGARRAAD
jgi:hypothetical protein